MICKLCPRRCGAERLEKTGSGNCGMGMLPVVSRAAPHMWEEGCLSGTRGCGTIFFAGCPLGCIYCQNHEISHLHQGKTMTVEELADIIKKMEASGVHNISFVTGTHFTPAILKALEIAKPSIPIVWNTGGYESIETLKLLEDKVDIYLPDFKHFSPRLGKVLANAPDYTETAQKAITEMIRQTGEPVYDENGMMLKGTIIRHLVLPGCTSDSMKVLDWIKENTPAGTPVSIMRQYTPMPQCTLKGMDRRITDEEYERVLDHARDLQLNASVQEAESAQSTYIPDFDLKD